MEDAQPNEVRLSRKGSTSVPHVRTTRPHRGLDSRSSKRTRWQSQATHSPPANSRTERPGQELVEVRLPPECQVQTPGSHNTRKRWIHDQKRHLLIHRHLSVVSFKCLDHDRSVLFTCRTQQASQFTRRNPRDTETGTHARPYTNNIGIVRPHGNYGGPARSNEPGPSRIRPTPWTLAEPEGYPQRLDKRSLASTSRHPAERKSVKSPALEIESRPVRTVHSLPFPRYRAAIHIATSTENIIDLTLDPSDSVAESNSARWSTFRSGSVVIPLPPLSTGLRASSSDASMDPRPDINQTPVQNVGQHEDVILVRDINLRLAQSSIRANVTVLARPMEDHQTSESLSDQLRQHDGPEVAGSSHPRDISVPPEDEAEISSPSGCSSLVRSFTSARDHLALSLGSHDKPRRILYHHDLAYIVTAHGIIDQVDATRVLKWGCKIQSPSLPYEEFVDDACISSHQGEPLIILGHAREQRQITFLSLEHGQAFRHVALHRDRNTVRRPGASAITPLLSPLKFASGGYDHRVHIWDIAQDLSGASAVELAIKHTSLIHSLLPIVDTSQKLVSVGADRDIPIYDLSAERVAHNLRVSCTPYHAHKTDTVFCTLLEVAHLETQFEVRDHRVSNQAVQRFGFITEERRGRYEKADTWSHFVICGDKNGAVHLWDLRNVSTEVALRQCFDDPIVQVTHTGSRLLACSKRNELACIDFQGG